MTVRAIYFTRKLLLRFGFARYVYIHGHATLRPRDTGWLADYDPVPKTGSQSPTDYLIAI